MNIKLKFRPAEYKNSIITIIDQTRLPEKLVYHHIRDYRTLGQAIKRLEVRGAPLLGIVSAWGIHLGLKDFAAHRSFNQFYSEFKKVAGLLKSTRPTAVNLFYAIDRMERVVKQNRHRSIKEIKQLLKEESDYIYQEDLQTGLTIGRFGANLIKGGSHILTHCNAGGLATSGLGTALACMFVAKSMRKKFHVWVDETRPLLQGARLTTWELAKWKIQHTLLCDNMAAFAMKEKKINLIIVGADRIVKNGDTANKIGTYNLAVLAYYHRIPFYVAAPSTTFDLNILTGKGVPIEERGREEVIKGFGRMTAPEDVCTWTPAFDVTPSCLITGFITEKGILKPPFSQSFKKIK
ncbi:MAG: S-methyl-5-thioribose-1-phosphate isomerase [Spirochaetes bacterium]|nr:S-methyl-5-thioribose-1-phosphate isomerase [Spirochaetota bacterium]